MPRQEAKALPRLEMAAPITCQLSGAESDVRFSLGGEQLAHERFHCVSPELITGSRGAGGRSRGHGETENNFHVPNYQIKESPKRTDSDEFSLLTLLFKAPPCLSLIEIHKLEYIKKQYLYRHLDLTLIRQSYRLLLRYHVKFRPGTLPFTLFLSLLGGITPLSIDMNLPALQLTAAAYHVSPASASLTLSLFLAGFALGPLILGPLSDRYGRRPMLLLGVGLFTLAGIGCALAPTFPILLLCRVIQGLGAGTGYSMPLAIIRDCFEKTEARVQMSYVSTVMALAPMIAPNLGIVVLSVASWHWIYGSLVIAGFLLFTLIYLCFSESMPPERAQRLDLETLVTNYRTVISHPVCLGYSLIAALNLGCMFCYITSSPLIMMDVLGVPTVYYGWTFASTAVGIMAGSFLNGKLLDLRFSAERLLSLGLTVSVSTALGLLAIGAFQNAHVYNILPLLIVSSASVGFIWPNASQGMLQPMPHMAGTASALLSAMRMGTGALGGFLTSQTYHHSTINMSAIMVTFSFGSFLCYLPLLRAQARRSTG